MDVECHHHEVATAGQCEIDFSFDTLLRVGRQHVKYKYVLRTSRSKHGKTVTFMPKPIFGDNGSGMHTHQSLWKKGKPLFAGDRYAGLQQMALWYIGGLLKHAPAIVGLLRAHHQFLQAPGARLRSAREPRLFAAATARAAVRIPMYSENPKAKRLEFRPPDPSCNPYLAFSAMLMAGLDGIENKIDPGKPLDKDIFELRRKNSQNVPSMSRARSTKRSRLSRRITTS